MSSVVEFTIGAENFRLGRLFRLEPGIDCELLEFVPVGGEPLPYLWISPGEMVFESIEATLREDETVGSLIPVTNTATDGCIASSGQSR